MKTPDITDRLLEQRLRAWYRAEIGQDESAPLTLRRDVVVIPRWSVRRTGLFGRGRGVTLFAAAALLLIGGAAAASGLLRLPSLVPQVALPTFAPLPSQSAIPTDAIPTAPNPTAPLVQTQPAQFGYIVGYSRTDQQLWIANMDGTGAHALVPDLGGNQQAPVWSPDGTRLLFSRAPATVGVDGYPDGKFSFYLTDATGSEPQLVDTGCVAPCVGDSDAAFSRDGMRLVFIRSFVIPPASSGINPATGKQWDATPASVLATIDLATGRVTELPSTTVLDCPLFPGQHDPGIPNCGGFAAHSPRWSPDGTQIVFQQDVPYDINSPAANDLINGMPPPPIYPPSSLFVVDADGQNLHQISICCGSADWSPDGTRIVIEKSLPSTPVINPGRGNGYTLDSLDDIYTVRPDGTDLVQVTSDTDSFLASWTADGRLFVLRVINEVELDATQELWIMNADGSNASQLSLSPFLKTHWPISAPAAAMTADNLTP